MLIKKLVIENYKSFQFPTEIDFGSISESNPIFLIGGMNNSGKSSIVEAIHYCLYGGRQDKIFSDINRKEFAKGNSYVKFELTFETDDNEEIIVSRSWTAGAIEKPRPKDLIEKLVVVKDGKRVVNQNQEMWQEFIDSKIPKSITQFFFFDGEKIQEIAQDEHTEIRLKNSLEAVLGIEQLRKLSEDISHIKNDERKNFIDITDDDIKLKELEINVEKTKLNRAEKERQEILEDINGFENELTDTKKRFEATFGIDPLKQDDIKQREKRRSQLINQLSKLDYEINGYLEKQLSFALSANLFHEIKKQIKSEQENLKSTVILESASEITIKIMASLDEPPPIWSITLDDEKRKLLSDRVLKVLQLESRKNTTPTILNLSEKDAAKILNKMEEVELSGITALEELLIDRASFSQEFKDLENQLQSTLATDSEKELFIQLQSSIESYATQIGKKKEELRIVEEAIISLTEKIQQKELELNKLFDKHSYSTETRAFIDECDSIATLMSNFIVRLRLNKINQLRDKTFEMYKRLASKSELISDVKIDEKTYEITIVDRDGHVVKKAGLSAGEKEIFAVSLLWGLAQTSEVNLPIIIDTPLSRLDTVHRENIVKNYFPNAGKQVIILSTDTEITGDYYEILKPSLSGTIQLKYDKINGITFVENGYFWS